MKSLVLPAVFPSSSIFFRCGYHYPPRMGYLRFCPLLADTFLMQWPFF
nr:MAG TPA: hypothetical protein [Caudoviricetes sp.]DAK04733.1 MAG TPA: hypothetical protein [Caudoviricetes sp.]DAL06160.1 MAG TPA: hypothetical protein [Caudoviricetes sp.]DAL90864.1 MAG TPA: hypothetical protein [Caudoviricetes sp.]DAM18385.1 MAG TPA: hypothetical protein [Caudoviricetes sp.]